MCISAHASARTLHRAEGEKGATGTSQEGQSLPSFAGFPFVGRERQGSARVPREHHSLGRGTRDPQSPLRGFCFSFEAGVG